MDENAVKTEKIHLLLKIKPLCMINQNNVSIYHRQKLNHQNFYQMKTNPNKICLIILCYKMKTRVLK